MALVPAHRGATGLLKTELPTTTSPFVLGTLLALILTGFSPAQAAMCGSSPETTSSGYYCPNMCRSGCPYPSSCSSACCGWYEDPVYGTRWGQTTCGASGSPCSLDTCGNGSCGACESHGSCSRDCSDGGSSEANPVIPWMEQAFARIPASGGAKLGFRFGTRDLGRVTMLDGSQYFLSDPIGAFPWFDKWLEGALLKSIYPVQPLPSVSAPVQLHTLSACHIQGFQRLRASPFVAYTFNSKAGGGGFAQCHSYSDGGAHLLMAKINSKSGQGYGGWGSNRGGGSRWNTPELDATQVNVLMDRVDSHPGGFQAVGDYLATGMSRGEDRGCQIKFWRVINPTGPVYLDTPSFTVPDGGHQAETTAMVRLADGRYLVAVGSHKQSQLDFYVSSGTYLPTSTFGHAGTWKLGAEGLAAGSLSADPFNYQSINLFRESGTHKIYMIASGRTEGLFGGFFDTCGADPLDGADYLHLLELWDWDDPPSGVKMRLAAIKHVTASECNLCAGGGVYAQPGSRDGRLALYCSEHQGDYESGSLEDTHIRTEGEIVWSQVLIYDTIPGPTTGVVRFNEFYP